ncbi:hypothetical protein BDW22DRAFT_1114942 [Trametopsis cervina]|nr:hypothetical protein BDW22DRAFT_1114942 [Trametopsis cervina]
MPPKRQPPPPPRASQRLRTAGPSHSTPQSGGLRTTDELAGRIESRLRISKDKDAQKDKNLASIAVTKRHVSRLPTGTRAKRPDAESDADALAATMKQKLSISMEKPKEMKTDSEICGEVMRAVNVASKALSSLAETGWKNQDYYQPASTPKASKASLAAKEDVASRVVANAEAIKTGLCTLRELRPGDIDIERAACSATGKLISLQCYHSALPILLDMLPALRSSYPSRDALPLEKTISSCTLDMLSLPLPEEPIHDKANLLTLISTYLAYALTTFTWTECSRLCKDTGNPTPFLKQFSDVLRTLPTLLRWLPYLRELSSRHLDSTLTSVYTALTKSTSLLSGRADSAKEIYDIRLYSLLLLVGTSPSALKPSMFWEQTVKFTVAFIKSVANPRSMHSPSLEAKQDTTTAVLDAFNLIVLSVNSRQDSAEWMSGHAFVAFCEYWIDFAKRASDLNAIKKASLLIRAAAPSDTRRIALSGSEDRSGSDPDTAVTLSIRPQDTGTLQAAAFCAVLAQTTALLEQRDSCDLGACDLSEAIQIMPHIEPFLIAAYDKPQDDQAVKKAANKVWRAFERLRRISGKTIDASSLESPQSRNLLPVIESMLKVLTSVLPKVQTGHEELLASALDSYFVLAKATFVVSRPVTFDRSFESLSSSLILVASLPASSLSALDRANFLRCISGAFHNLGAALYQAGHFSHAIRFFEKSCPVGDDALKRHRATVAHIDSMEGNSESESQWTTLEEQLHRRWEILAVCHSKTGDRKSAFEAFGNAVKSFSFETQPYPDHPSTKHLVTIIDRMSYIGLCDLFLPIEQVSLKVLLSHLMTAENNAKSQTRATLGALLERQAEGLESSKWKPAVHNAVCHLLQDALEIYTPQDMPVRRARVILKYLETALSTNDDKATSLSTTEELALEAEALLRTKDFGLDTNISGLCLPYLAALKLRMAHAAHQRAEQVTGVLKYVEEACTILKSILSPRTRQSLAKPVSPARARPQMVKTAMKRPGLVARAAPVRSRIRGTKLAAAQPVTPKPRRSSSSKLQPIPRLSFGAPPVIEHTGQLIALLYSTSHLLSLLGQVVMKVQVLLLGRRLSEQQIHSQPDDYISFSTDLAHEYVNLGKTGKAASIYTHTWSAMDNMNVSQGARVMFLLRYSESLIAVGNILKSSTSYSEASSLAQEIDSDEGSSSSAQRVLTRTSLLERAAVAATTFASIQYARDDPVTSINGMLQSLRLWNRAFDTLSRLSPPSIYGKATASDADNPFLQEQKQPVANHTPSSSTAESQSIQRIFERSPFLRGIGWRILEGLLSTLFSLTRAYVSRGSPREAEFFAQQAKDLSIVLNMPAITSRALARLGEIYLHLGELNDSHSCLTEAATMVSDASGPDAAEIRRLHAEHSRMNANQKEAKLLYDEAIGMLEELDQKFTTIDGHALGSRKSDVMSPKSPKSPPMGDTLAPSLLLAILRQNIWLLHEEGAEYHQLLERLRNLPQTAEIKAEENALMARLKLEDAYSRFQADMFLSSLAESAITLPMGMKRQKTTISASTHEILGILNNAEKLFWSDLALLARRGNVFHVRDAAISLALIRAFQDTIGKADVEGPTLAARLLDKSTAITLRREVLEVVQYKFGDQDDHNDLQWPLITPNGSPLSPPKRQNARGITFQLEDDGEVEQSEKSRLTGYWQSLAERYQSQVYDASHLSNPQTGSLPPNWTVISISVTEDKDTMLVTRQSSARSPLILYLPLKERRDGDDEEYLTFENALAELREIIQLSDNGTREAAGVRNNREARATWWAGRMALDKRMKQLLDNIEFCWLGAFKTILSQPRSITQAALEDLRTRLEKVFARNFALRDKKQMSQVRLDDVLLECFACLPSKSRDEELEDLVYFILDFYQFHGIPVAIAEIDIDQVVIDFRTALEEHARRYRSQSVPQEDSHLFLVLDKNVQGIPWESIPILRGQSVSRIPSIDFLLDRVQYASSVRGTAEASTEAFTINPRETFFVLNPSGDLKNTEGRFINWLQDMKSVGWTGIVGKAPSELQVADALMRKDLFIYFGHGGAEQYIRSRKIRHLPKCAATMLWGCSSGALKEMGDFDRTGTPYNYMLAGCPTLVANLWDVTDRDIDKFSQSVFDKMHLTADDVKAWQPDTSNPDRTSIVSAVAQSRDVCKLKYLTGAAPIVYGIPFYL